MKVTRITGAGIVEDTGEILPDRENLTPTSVNRGTCRQTGKPTCTSSDLCKECAYALDRILARLGPPREWTEEDREIMRSRARRGKR